MPRTNHNRVFCYNRIFIYLDLYLTYLLDVGVDINEYTIPAFSPVSLSVALKTNNENTRFIRHLLIIIQYDTDTKLFLELLIYLLSTTASTVRVPAKVSTSLSYWK